MSDQKIILTIHENIIKRLRGPKAPIGKSNPAIHSRVQGRKNLIRGVVELSKRPSPKARESLRKIARAADQARRSGLGDPPGFYIDRRRNVRDATFRR